MIGWIIGLVIGVGIWMLSWIKKIPAEPPHVALVTILGRRIRWLKKEGFRIFWGYPLVMNFILIKVEKVNQDLPTQTVRTPDLAPLEIPISVTWTPAWRVKHVDKITGKETERESPEYLIEYLNSGGEEGIKTILEDIIREKLREWAMSTIEGPQNYTDCMAAGEEAVAVLLKAILGDELERIPSEIPTILLLKYFPDENDYKFSKKEKEDWYKENSWKAIYDKYPPEKEKEIEKAIKRRKEEVRKVRQGDGWFLHPSLGIILNRLNVGEIKPLGGSRLEKAMELKVTENEEREGERVELSHVAERIKELMKLGFSKEQAQEIVQTERGKVGKQIFEYKGLPSAIPFINIGEGTGTGGRGGREGEKTEDGSEEQKGTRKAGYWPALEAEREKNLKEVRKK